MSKLRSEFNEMEGVSTRDKKTGEFIDDEGPFDVKVESGVQGPSDRRDVHRNERRADRLSRS